MSRTVAHVVDTWLIVGICTEGSVGYVVIMWEPYEAHVVDTWLP